jgi:CO/xanthine dehydrogenase Mo-binding subunit
MSWACCVVEVELDTVSLGIRLRGIWLSLAVGQVIDDRRIKAVVESELAETYERCTGGEERWDGPSSSRPKVAIEFLPEGSRAGAVEGLAAGTFAPAYISAVSQATGFYFDSIPLNRALVYQYVEA